MTAHSSASWDSLLTMRTTLIFFTAFPLTLLAQTDAARELARLQEQRGEALAAAAEPINRRYQQGLEQLLRRATQANDLETAMKIKAAIASLPQEVIKQLTGAWTLQASTGYGAEVSFRSDGSGTHSGYGKFRWHIEGSTLYLGPSDTAADRFQLPIKEGRLKGFNSIGNELTLTKK